MFIAKKALRLGRDPIPIGLLLPSPSWEGVGGGGQAVGHVSAIGARPPTPTFPQSKPRIRGFRPMNGVIEISDSRFGLGEGAAAAISGRAVRHRKSGGSIEAPSG